MSIAEWVRAFKAMEQSLQFIYIALAKIVTRHRGHALLT